MKQQACSKCDFWQAVDSVVGICKAMTIVKVGEEFQKLYDGSLASVDTRNANVNTQTKVLTNANFYCAMFVDK